MSAVTQKALNWTEMGMVPDSVIRHGIRRLLERKLAEIEATDIEKATSTTNAFVEMMNESPIALVPHIANEQHYEVPAEFFDLVLGEHRKYSCCYWDESVENLDDAEARALEITIRRAGIEDGMEVLDLGCGWGSVSLYIASQFPRSRVTSVSNSQSQHDFITASTISSLSDTNCAPRLKSESPRRLSDGCAWGRRRPRSGRSCSSRGR